MKIIKLEQNHKQELNQTVDIEVKTGSGNKTLKNVQCYNPIVGIFYRCLGWSLTIHHRDLDGIMTLFFISKESLYYNAQKHNVDLSKIVIESVLWVDEKAKMAE